MWLGKENTVNDARGTKSTATISGNKVTRDKNLSGTVNLPTASRPDSLNTCAPVNARYTCALYISLVAVHFLRRSVLGTMNLSHDRFRSSGSTSGDVIETTGANTDTYWSRFFCYYKYLSGTQRFFILHNLLILYNDVGNLKGRYQNKFLFK